MNCGECRRLMSDCIDGVSDSNEEAEMHAHLTKCSACRKEVEEIRKLNRLLKARTLELPDKSYWNRLPSRIFASLDRHPLKQRLYGYSIPAAAAVILVTALAVSFLMQESRPSPHTAKKVSHTQEMTRHTIAAANAEGLVLKAEKMTEIMDIHLQRIHDMVQLNLPNFAEQYTLSYCKVVKNGCVRILREADARGANSQQIRDIFKETASAHVIEFKELIKLSPEKKETLEKAVDTVSIL